MNMNSISSINCRPQQPAKALGFGCAGGDLDGEGDGGFSWFGSSDSKSVESKPVSVESKPCGGSFSYFGPKSVESKPVSVESKPISFENQVLANQQKMIKGINHIESALRNKGIYDGSQDQF